MQDGFIDVESRSRINLKTEGDDRYTAACECTMIQWAVDNDDVKLWDPWTDGPELPRDLDEVLDDDSICLIAHNSPFDRKVIHRSLRRRTNLSRWRCTRAQAYSVGLPGSLDTLGLVLGLSEEERKLSDGAALIQFFCVPQADGTFRSPLDFPLEWERFRVYGKQDTATLRTIYRRLPRVNYVGANLAQWHVDQLINGRGFGFNQELAQAAVRLLEKAKGKADAEILCATGGTVAAATQRDKLLNYLVANGLYGLTDLRAATIRDALESSDLPGHLRKLLELRLEASKSSGSKYKKGLTIVGRDSRIRGAEQFSGAGRTGRFSHKGFQPGNMSRPSMMVRKPNGKVELEPVKAKYIDEVVIPAVMSGAALHMPEIYGGPNTACALSLRHCIRAAIGCELVVADFSNIEGCITAWVAGEEWKLTALRDKFNGCGPDVYKLLYSRFFGLLIDTINDTQRQAGKVIDLSMGFHGGVGAFATMAAGYGIDLSILPGLVTDAPEKMKAKAYKAWRRAFLTGNDFELDPAVYQACDILKQLYRTASPAIDTVAYDIDRATKGVLESPNTLFEAAKCKIWYTGKELLIQLPSGRRLTYFNPQLHVTRSVDPITGGDLRVSGSISYMSARGKTWFRIKAWMGLFLENIVQATAADLLRESLVRVHDYCNTVPAIAAYLATLPEDERSAIALHVHDEIVLDVPVNSISLEKLIELMCQKSECYAGLPLHAEGWKNPVYGKR